MQKVNKGYRVEKRCADELVDQGYKLLWKTIRVKYKKLDIGGLFDLLLLSPGEKKLVFIQCKSNRVENSVRDAIRNFKLPESCEKWIYIWKDRKGFVREFYP